MIIGDKSTTVAYRCPACGSFVLSMVGVFSLSADMIKLKCSCGQSEMTLSRIPGQKVQLTVPCLTCPSPHSYQVSTDTFFDRDLLRLGCHYTDIDVCFIGGKEAIMQAIEESDRELMKLMQEMGVEDFHILEGGDILSDDSMDDCSALYNLARFMLCELEDEDGVVCRCKNHQPGSCDLELLEDEENSVRFFCTECGAAAVYPAEELFNSDGSFRTEKLYLL